MHNVLPGLNENWKNGFFLDTVDFFLDPVTKIFQTFYNYDLAWCLQIQTRFDDLDLKVTGMSLT